VAFRTTVAREDVWSPEADYRKLQEGRATRACVLPLAITGL
jgi:hypothetical protein